MSSHRAIWGIARLPSATVAVGRRGGIGLSWPRAAILLGWGAFVVVFMLGAVAPMRRTGDAHQYHAMAAALSELRPPALTEAETVSFANWLSAQPADSGFPGSVRAIRQPVLVVDGRQEFSHFWFYPLLAAPFVATARAAGVHAGYGFLALNGLLLGLALWSVQRRFRPGMGLLLLASPIVWFVNKAQVEIFTFALLCLAMAEARRGRFLWAGLAAAVASTQNAPILAAVPCFWAAAVVRRRLDRASQSQGGGPALGLRDALVVAATVAVGALHPAYYRARLGVLTPQRLNGGIDAGLPSPQRYLAVLLDPDLGLLAWVPLLGVLALVGLVFLLVPRGRSIVALRGGGLDLRLTAACAVVIGGWFLFVFSQTTNVNSGGTVHVSRYVLWLLPLLLPLLDASASWLQRRSAPVLPLIGVAAFATYAITFRPSLPEQYVTPSPQSEVLNAWLPGAYRQVPEVFFERHRGIDGASPDWAANKSCTVILVGTAAEPPCPLSPAERHGTSRLFAEGWQAVWVVRPGKLGLGAGGVSGAVRAE